MRILGLLLIWSMLCGCGMTAPVEAPASLVVGFDTIETLEQQLMEFEICQELICEPESVIDTDAAAYVVLLIGVEFGVAYQGEPVTWMSLFGQDDENLRHIAVDIWRLIPAETNMMVLLEEYDRHTIPWRVFECFVLGQRTLSGVVTAFYENEPGDMRLMESCR